MSNRPLRLAVRALILDQNKLLLVNAWAGGVSNLWCAPGGGVEKHSSLADNLRREVHEETGLEVAVGEPCMVNEFHDPRSGFHQVDVYFRATITHGQIDPAWRDPEGVVTDRRFFAEHELADIRFKPSTMAEAVWGGKMVYDPLELLVR